MKCHLAPSILSFDLASLSESLPKVMAAGASILHLDVMDGQFVPPISFGDCLAKSIRLHTQAPMEAHLMTLTPERQFDAFIAAGCERIIFHAEATVHGHRLAQSLRSRGVQSGVAINPGTPVSAIEALIDEVDLVLVMTVNPGWGGQSFLPSTLGKIAEIRRRRPDVEIQVDGGIDPSTLPRVKEAGANVFVVGSYLLRATSLEAGVHSITELF